MKSLPTFTEEEQRKKKKIPKHSLLAVENIQNLGWIELQRPLHEIFWTTTETLAYGTVSQSCQLWLGDLQKHFPSFLHEMSKAVYYHLHSWKLFFFLYFCWGGAGKHGTECSLELCCKCAKRRVLCFTWEPSWMAGVWEVMVLILLLKSCGKRNNSRSKKKRWGQVQCILCRIPKSCVLIFSQIFRSLYLGFVF